MKVVKPSFKASIIALSMTLRLKVLMSSTDIALEGGLINHTIPNRSSVALLIHAIYFTILKLE